MGRKRSEYYIDKEELVREIKLYKKTSLISEELGKMLLLLAYRYANKFNFIGYSYKDEFISDAVLRMVDQLNKIDPYMENSQPFSYLTLTCHRCFVARINKEKKYQVLKERLKDKYFDLLEDDEQVSFKKNNDNDDLSDFIAED